MPDKANFTRAEASVQLALVKKGDYIARVADGFALQARKTNQLGRLKISQRTFQPGKRYGFYCCGFRLCFVKEEIRQLPRGRVPYYMNHKRKTHQKKKRQLRSVSVSVFKSVMISPRVKLNGALFFCKCSYLS